MATCGEVVGAGCAGICSVYLIFLGVLLIIPGAIVTAIGFGDDDWKDDDDNSVMRVVGPVLLVVAFLMIVGAIVLCVHICKVGSRSRMSRGSVLATASTTTTTVGPGVTQSYPLQTTTYQPPQYVPPQHTQPTGTAPGYSQQPKAPLGPPNQQPSAPPLVEGGTSQTYLQASAPPAYEEHAEKIGL